MPKILKIDFFSTEDDAGNANDISNHIRTVSQLAFELRRVDFGDSFVFIHNARLHHNRILGQVVKVKMNEVPEKVSRERGDLQDLGLGPDEGIGHTAHFLYDPESCALAFQRDREVRATAFTESVSVPARAQFALSYIFKERTMERLGRMRMVRRLSFKLARPQHPEVLRELDPSASHAIDLLNDADGRFIDVAISVGRARNTSLNRNSVVRAARQLFGQQDNDVQRIVVSGKEGPDAPTEVLDLLEDRLTYEEQVDYRRRRLESATCERVLQAAYEMHSRYLREFRAAG